MQTTAKPAVVAEKKQECIELERVDQYLREKYKETMRGVGHSARGYVLMLYMSKNGTWSAVAVMPNGCVRVLDAGEGWQVVGSVA